jgi:uncharacterized membrane protein
MYPRVSGKLLLAFASTVILGSVVRGTHDHISVPRRVFAPLFSAIWSYLNEVCVCECVYIYKFYVTSAISEKSYEVIFELSK